MSVKITRRVPKSHALFENHTHACSIAASQNPIRITVVSVTITFVHLHCVWQLHCACRKHTLRVEITVVCVSNYTQRVEISLCVWEAHSTCIKHARAC
jgi:hypothetical protein